LNYYFSEKEKSQYAEEGFILREDQFSSGELDSFRKIVEATVRSADLASKHGKAYFLDKKKFVDIDSLTLQYEPKPNDNCLRVIEPAHSLNSQLELIIKDRRLTDPIKSILSVNKISLWTDKLNLKRPEVGSGFGWHQDSPYWVHDSSDVDSLPNVYLCLDDSSKSNGCFSVIAGSHTKGCLPGTADGTQLGGFYTDQETFDLKNSVDLEAAAGSVIFFNPHLVHGSSSNTSKKERRAYIITYQPENRAMLKSGLVNNI
tara:strand:+ start:6280 stop:7056 length:777 start_codon:yes stop_codon:yes gene_type:complete